MRLVVDTGIHWKGWSRARVAELSESFKQNMNFDGEHGVVFVEAENQLDGLAPAQRKQAAAAAAAKSRPGVWAVANERGAVWPVLTHTTDRGLREQVWRMWTGRGDHADEHDNKPLMAEVLSLRGQKARLLGYPSYAHFAMADAWCASRRRWKPCCSPPGRA